MRIADVAALPFRAVRSLLLRIGDAVWHLNARFPGIWKGVGLSLAGLFTLWQFVDYQRQQDIARTITYIERYEADPVRSARKSLDMLIGEVSGDLPDTMSPASRIALTFALIDKDKPRYERDIDDVVDFYESLHICIVAELCTPDVAERYFEQDANEFYSNWFAYVESRHANNPRYGLGLRTIAKVNDSDADRAKLEKSRNQIKFHLGGANEEAVR